MSAPSNIAGGGPIGLAAVNVGVPSVLGEARGATVWSGIHKEPVATGTTLWLSLNNLAGDGQADLVGHGGPDKAVYAYPSEHLARWTDELDAPLGDAAFGENLSTIGPTEGDTNIGDVWEWGEAVLQVCQPRWPCSKLALHRGRADIQGLFRASGRTGWYLRVLQPGAVGTDGPITLAGRDAAALTVADAHRAMGDRSLEDAELVRRLADHGALAEQWRVPLADRLSGRT